ncbi:hypothetical protein ASF60_22515 [Methylobacterium sp. Leaf113]|uniref:DUF2235 domain-containing protein n=1 Tax=Methylobacterium sp. Leaf113 TaxID=1736259 RepID=UPI0007008DC0|nr:DUF2235 domain-containing protein [Methylobacterium sp. Leaf113]KQP80734.1 hypothetical protein ASF60_22515 [Methylobacterium sp. Leaf113]
MAKNIVIFSDGTGQSGGLLPDENRSNVYKLFRAARVCPDTSINPAEQVAFYDVGLGSKAAGSNIKIGWWRRLYNVLSSATGLGITQNIIDCYAAIVRVWEPDDRIYLIGFSRGAYTVRCVGAALALCGIPTRAGPGQPLRRDAASVNAIAKEAIKQVYQFGASKTGDPYKHLRMELADQFRQQHACAAPTDSASSNAYPYFIGVWDTVATLGLTTKRTLGLLTGVVVLFGVLALLVDLVLSWFGVSFGAPFFWHTFAWICGVGAAIGLIAYLRTYVKFTTKSRLLPWYKTLHVTGLQMEFYDTSLNPNVQHARHALAIDENRQDFDRVPWTDRGAVVNEQKKNDANYIRLKQVWFAGVHSDVGGSYPENEARLSDIALEWMISEARAIKDPLLVDTSVLHLWPAVDGPQHDERKNTVAGWPAWFVRLLTSTRIWTREELGWKPLVRDVPDDAPLHASVLERFAVPSPGVLQYDLTEPYRPPALHTHCDVRKFYEAPATVPTSGRAGV